MPRVTITVPDKNAQPYRFPLDRKKVTLGRGSSNDIAIDSTSVSHSHAVMERTEKGYILKDLNSTNGTKYEGKSCDEIELNSGISVSLGDVAFDFTLSDEELDALGVEEDDESPVIKEKKSPNKISVEQISELPSISSLSKPILALSGVGLLLLAILGFFLGLSLRYSKEHGGQSLFKDLTDPPTPEEVEAAKIPPVEEIVEEETAAESEEEVVEETAVEPEEEASEKTASQQEGEALPAE